jgi:hypothetical protein
MILIYQPPNAHVRISGILLRNAMAVAAVKKIYWDYGLNSQWVFSFWRDTELAPKIKIVKTLLT